MSNLTHILFIIGLAAFLGCSSEATMKQSIQLDRSAAIEADAKAVADSQKIKSDENPKPQDESAVIPSNISGAYLSQSVTKVNDEGVMSSVTIKVTIHDIPSERLAEVNWKVTVSEPTVIFHSIRNYKSNESIDLELSGGTLQEILTSSDLFLIDAQLDSMEEPLVSKKVFKPKLRKAIYSSNFWGELEDILEPESPLESENDLLTSVCEDCSVWFDASDFESFSGLACNLGIQVLLSNQVHCWRDKSGKGNHAHIVGDLVQAPLFLSKVSPDGASFNGVKLNGNSALQGTIKGFEGGNHPYTIILVYTPELNSFGVFNNLTFGIGNLRTVNQSAMIENSSDGVFINHWRQDFKISNVATLNQRRIVAVSYDALTDAEASAGNFRTNVDGDVTTVSLDEDETPNGAINLPIDSKVHIGTLDTTASTINEAIVYDRSLTAEELSQITMTLKEKWGL